jgi:hypothetical protein
VHAVNLLPSHVHVRSSYNAGQRLRQKQSRCTAQHDAQHKVYRRVTGNKQFVGDESLQALQRCMCMPSRRVLAMGPMSDAATMLDSACSTQ